MRQLSVWCKPSSSKGQRLQRAPQPASLCPATAASLWASHGHSLVWARFSLLAKGRPELHAMVCVPTDEDLRLLSKEPRCMGPQEPLHVDHFRKRVKSARKGKKKKGGKAKGASEEQVVGSDGVAEKPDSTSDPSQRPTEQPSSVPALTQNQEVVSTPSRTSDGDTDATPAVPKASVAPSAPAPAPAPATEERLVLGLWPEPLPSVTSHCSRVTLGWVTQGDFSLAAGCGEALGLVSLTGLLQALLRQPPEQRGLLLLRNPSSLQYRFAKVTIEA